MQYFNQILVLIKKIQLYSSLDYLVLIEDRNSTRRSLNCFFLIFWLHNYDFWLNLSYSKIVFQLVLHKISVDKFD